MAIEYASKYSGKVDERFATAAMTNQAVNNDYDFTGVDTVKVYSIANADLNDYALTGSNRYGEPEDLGNTAQSMVLSQDKAFTFIIDKKAEDDTEGAMDAGRALRRQIDEVVIPTVDKYRISRMVAGAGKTATKAVTNANAYDAFLDGMNALTDAGVPLTGRLAFVSPAYYKAIKQDSTFVKSGDASQELLMKGSLGLVDGANIIQVPTSYLPANVAFVVTHKSATVGPVKLQSYKIHDNPPGINGKLVEGRIRYDAFVLDSKKGAIYVHKTA